MEVCVKWEFLIECQTRPTLSCGVSRTGPDQIPVIAEEARHVAQLCIGKGMGTMSTATAITEMEAGSVN